MKKLMIIVFVGLVFGSFSGVFAKEATTQPMKMKKMMGMHSKSQMSHMMCRKSHRKMVTTKDGGVVVMSGNKLFKYDKFLNLKKAAVIPETDDDDMSMMKGECPMMKKKDKSEDESSKPTEESDHESHH